MSDSSVSANAATAGTGGGGSNPGIGGLAGGTIDAGGMVSTVMASRSPVTTRRRRRRRQHRLGRGCSWRRRQGWRDRDVHPRRGVDHRQLDRDEHCYRRHGWQCGRRRPERRRRRCGVGRRRTRRRRERCDRQLDDIRQHADGRRGRGCDRRRRAGRRRRARVRRRIGDPQADDREQHDGGREHGRGAARRATTRPPAASATAWSSTAAGSPTDNRARPAAAQRQPSGSTISANNLYAAWRPRPRLETGFPPSSAAGGGLSVASRARPPRS